MTKEDFIDFIDKNIDNGMEIDFIIATKDDNYTAFRDKPIINKCFDGSFELTVELPDIFEVSVSE